MSKGVGTSWRRRIAAVTAMADLTAACTREVPAPTPAPSPPVVPAGTSWWRCSSTLVAGAGVTPGPRAGRVDHSSVLRSIAGRYALAPLGRAADAAPLSLGA